MNNEPKKLQLHRETLKRLDQGVVTGRGGEVCTTSGACTVWTTCSPGCCDTPTTIAG